MTQLIDSTQKDAHGIWATCSRLIQLAPFAVQTLFVALVFAAAIAVLGISVALDYIDERDFTAGEIGGLQILETFGPLNNVLLIAKSNARVKAARFNSGATSISTPFDVESLFAPPDGHSNSSAYGQSNSST
jgi:hypothetical protein